MNSNKVVVYKKPGQTPLECLNETKSSHPEWSHLPVTYAGRLDPLAEGALILLVGDECLKKDEYLALSKEYELSVLFGFRTDTYDLMGKVTESSAIPENFSDIIPQIKEKLKNFIGRINQEYPPYSSRTVLGKPLYKWAREGRLDEIKIPSHDVFVENIEFLGLEEITSEQLEDKIKNVIHKVNGDFRQDEILNLWKNILSEKNNGSYPIIKLRVSCGSGVYVRSVANSLGDSIGIPALAFKIVRTKIGEYSVASL